MKIRTDFVTNSSSSSFIITNKTKEEKTLVDFVEENPDLVEDFKSMYGSKNDTSLTQEEMISCAKLRNEVFPAKSEGYYDYGDDDGDTLGRVFDYILRGGGQSKSFKWEFSEFDR